MRNRRMREQPAQCKPRSTGRWRRMSSTRHPAAGSSSQGRSDQACCAGAELVWPFTGGHDVGGRGDRVALGRSRGPPGTGSQFAGGRDQRDPTAGPPANPGRTQIRSRGADTRDSEMAGRGVGRPSGPAGSHRSRWRRAAVHRCQGRSAQLLRLASDRVGWWQGRRGLVFTICAGPTPRPWWRPRPIRRWPRPD
jgi:hypothetical protein